MSFAGFNVEDALGWGAVPGPAEGTDLVTQAIKKEKLIKCVSLYSVFPRIEHLFREIQASQEGLRGSLSTFTPALSVFRLYLFNSYACKGAGCTKGRGQALIGERGSTDVYRQFDTADGQTTIILLLHLFNFIYQLFSTPTTFYKR